MLRKAFGRVAVLALLGFSFFSFADEGPQQGRSESESQAAPNVLALNQAMFPVYERALHHARRVLLGNSPVIVAQFSGRGGQMTLYVPGKDPIKADPPPQEYEFAKSCAHSGMAIYQLTAPYLDNAADESWREPMKAFLEQNRKALTSLAALKMEENKRRTCEAILQLNISFMENSLQKRFTQEDIDSFARKFKPLAEQAVWIAASAQVHHWMTVLDGWKKMLGPQWEKTYAVTNTIYVTRQNNILFTILAQYMGEEAINRRLLLFETTDFTATDEQMLDLLARIVSDRALGETYFGDYYLMDYELLGSGARRAISEETAKRGNKALLPTVAPFNSNQWPWRTDPSRGSGPATLEEIKRR